MDEKRKQSIAMTLLLQLYSYAEITNVDIATEIIILMKRLNKKE